MIIKNSPRIKYSFVFYKVVQARKQNEREKKYILMRCREDMLKSSVSWSCDVHLDLQSRMVNEELLAVPQWAMDFSVVNKEEVNIIVSRL